MVSVAVRKWNHDGRRPEETWPPKIKSFSTMDAISITGSLLCLVPHGIFWIRISLIPRNPVDFELTLEPIFHFQIKPKLLFQEGTVDFTSLVYKSYILPPEQMQRIKIAIQPLIPNREINLPWTTIGIHLFHVMLHCHHKK